MNPFCSNCKVLTRVRWGKTDAGHDENTKVQKSGRTKFFICPKCGRRWQVGAEVIQRKTDPAKLREQRKIEKEAEKDKHKDGGENVHVQKA